MSHGRILVLPQIALSFLIAPWAHSASAAQAPAASAHSSELLLSAMEQHLEALQADPGNRAVQRSLFDLAKKLAELEKLPPDIETERVQAVNSARIYLAAEGAKLQRLRGQLGKLLQMSANSKDPLMILEASRQAQDLDPLLEDRQLEEYAHTIYLRLDSILNKGLITDRQLMHEAKGYLYYHNKEWEEAEKEWAKALSSGKDDKMLKDMMEKAKKNALQEKNLAQALNLLAKGKAYRASAQYEKAVNALQALLALQPDHGEARDLLRDSQAKFAQQEKNRQIAEHLAFGVALKKKRKLLDASEHFLKVLQLDPTNETAQAYLKDMMSDLASAPGASKEEFGDAGGSEGASPAELTDRADTYYARGLMAYVRGDKKSAKENWQRATRIYPAHQKARIALERVSAEERLLINP